jgi:hypothetical protein
MYLLFLEDLNDQPPATEEVAPFIYFGPFAGVHSAQAIARILREETYI